MGYIYKITNTINGKVYIGKTERSIEQRWQEHLKFASTELNEQRPLYNAIRKYGVNNFIIEVVEETKDVNEREQYWINYYNSYKEGYNATLGGDGKTLYDYDYLVALYEKEQNVTKVAKICGCSEHHLSKILQAKGIQILTQQEVNKKRGLKILQYDKQGNFITGYFSAKEAARAIQKPDATSHITAVCKGIRKSAYGFIWKFADS